MLVWRHGTGRPRLRAGALAWVLALVPVSDLVERVDHAFPIRGHADYAGAHHDYPATDVFADCGSPVVSPVAGTVDEVSRVDRWDPRSDLGRDRGGKSFSVIGWDGVRYYGSHLSSLRPGLRPGTEVGVGERVGRVGRTGNARSVPCHLHFGISPVCPGRGEWWVRRGVVSPYRVLRQWEAGGNSAPLPAVSRWERKNGCPLGP